MRTPLLVPILALAGCASTPINAPSLLPRAIETRSDAEPVVEQDAVAADPALDAVLIQRVATFTKAGAAFDATRARASTRIQRARGARAGSEAWLDAQQALGELQQARTASEAALADLEELAIERAGTGRLPYPALDAEIAKATAQLERQVSAEAALAASVAG